MAQGSGVSSLQSSRGSQGRQTSAKMARDRSQSTRKVTDSRLDLARSRIDKSTKNRSKEAVKVTLRGGHEMPKIAPKSRPLGQYAKIMANGVG